MTWNRTRLDGWALIIGTIVATTGYLAAGTLIHGHGDARFTSSLWQPLNGIAIAGNIIIASPFLSVLGLPGPLADLSDYLAFIALATIGLQALRTRTEHLEPSPSLADTPTPAPAPAPLAGGAPARKVPW